MNIEKSEDPIQIAIYKPSGQAEQFIHIDSIAPTDRQVRDNCYCWKCNEKLEAVLEFKDKSRIKFFRHNNSDCKGSQETALHELAKQILVTGTHLATKEHGLIDYMGAVAENRLEQKRPDVSAIFEGKPIYFEVYVSHAVDSGKEKFFIGGKHRSLEIDLSDCTTTSFDEIKRLVLEETSNKKIFYWNDEAQTEESFWSKYLPWLVGILIIFGIIKAASQRKRR